MTLSQNGINLIKGFEGFRSKPYGDVVGVQTVGYGHAIKHGEKFTQVTEQVAEQLLYADTIAASNCVNVHVVSQLNQNQFDALVSFTYNLGCGTFKNSTLLKLLNADNFADAAEEFPKYDHAGGQVVRGLSIRREKERALFLSPMDEQPTV